MKLLRVYTVAKWAASRLLRVSYCSVLQCVAVCCSVLQCVAVCCSVLTIESLPREALKTWEFSMRIFKNERIFCENFVYFVTVNSTPSDFFYQIGAIGFVLLNLLYTMRVVPTWSLLYTTILSVWYSEDMLAPGWQRPIGCLQLEFFFLGKEPLMIGLFCGKWPANIRQPMGVRHPLLDAYSTDLVISKIEKEQKLPSRRYRLCATQFTVHNACSDDLVIFIHDNIECVIFSGCTQCL